jgi:hypothetical protein
VVNTQITDVADDVARQVIRSMAGLRANLDPHESVYVSALVVPDDSSSVDAYANTTGHFTASAVNQSTNGTSPNGSHKG